MWGQIFKIALVWAGSFFTGIIIAVALVVLLVWNTTHASESDYDWSAWNEAPTYVTIDPWDLDMLVAGWPADHQKRQRAINRCEQAIASYLSAVTVLKIYTPEGEDVFEWFAENIAERRAWVAECCDPVKDWPEVTWPGEARHAN